MEKGDKKMNQIEIVKNVFLFILALALIATMSVFVNFWVTLFLVLLFIYFAIFSKGETRVYSCGIIILLSGLLIYYGWQSGPGILERDIINAKERSDRMLGGVLEKVITDTSSEFYNPSNISNVGQLNAAIDDEITLLDGVAPKLKERRRAQSNIINSQNGDEIELNQVVSLINSIKIPDNLSVPVGVMIFGIITILIGYVFLSTKDKRSWFVGLGVLFFLGGLFFTLVPQAKNVPKLVGGINISSLSSLSSGSSSGQLRLLSGEQTITISDGAWSPWINTNDVNVDYNLSSPIYIQFNNGEIYTDAPGQLSDFSNPSPIFRFKSINGLGEVTLKVTKRY